MRYSFASHLLKSRTDLRYIQELLGPKSSKTSEIYIHVSERSFGHVHSPLDTFQKKSNQDNKKLEVIGQTDRK